MNIFTIPENLGTGEIFEQIFSQDNVRIERIVSCGQSSPPGFWYDQEWHEWVVLLQGKAEIEWPDGTRQYLDSGDHLFIPAHQVHRVAYTSTEPPCIWLAVHMEPRSA